MPLTAARSPPFKGGFPLRAASPPGGQPSLDREGVAVGDGWDDLCLLLHYSFKPKMREPQSILSVKPSQVLGGCLSEAKAGGFIYSRKAHTRLTDKTIPAQMTQNFRELASPRGSWPRSGLKGQGMKSQAAKGRRRSTFPR